MKPLIIQAVVDEKVLRLLADVRHDLHKNQSTSRPLSDDYEYVGILGELSLATYLGLPLDLRLFVGGDDRVDFETVLGTVDVKTARKPFNLLREKDKEHADILVLAKYRGRRKFPELLGWEWDRNIVLRPAKDFGYGIVNHYVPAGELRPMEGLRELIDAWEF